MVTQQQLKSAMDDINLINQTMTALQDTVQTAINLKVAGIDLSNDQTFITALQNQYATLKTQLGTLVQSLP